MIRQREKVGQLSTFRDILIPIGILIVITLLVTLYQEEIRALAYYGYLGMFVACVAANATVFLPAPSTAVVFTFASVYPPFWVAVVGGIGATTGELFGYLAGYFGRRVIEATAIGPKVQAWFSERGAWAVGLLAFLPLPIFDVVGVMAGSSRMNVVAFVALVAMGKVLKMLIYAYLGAGLIPALAPLLDRLTSG